MSYLADPKYEAKLQDLERRLLDGPGQLDPAIRRAVAGAGEIPDELTAYVEKVRRHAYQVTDDDIDRLRAAGYTDDQIFELTVAAAHGAAHLRLRTGLEAMGASSLRSATGGTDR